MWVYENEYAVSLGPGLKRYAFTAVTAFVALISANNGILSHTRRNSLAINPVLFSTGSDLTNACPSKTKKHLRL